MVKVLHMINGADLGGISSMILNYYSHMDRDTYQFDFVSPLQSEGVNGKKLQELGCRFFYIKKKSDGLINHIRELDNLLKKEHYDVIHVHSNHTSYVGLMVAWKNHIPIRIAHGHNAVKSRPSLKGRISRRAGIILIKIFSTKRLACSKDSAIYTFGKHSLKEKSMQILPNAIDVEKFRYEPAKRVEMRKSLGISQDVFLVGCVGRMSKEKNHIFLVELMPKVIEKCPNAYLILVGDGDERIKLENQAEELGIRDRIIFTGSRSDIPELLDTMDVFVLPSLNEGLGIVALEAAASGLPEVLSEYVPKELCFIPNSTFLSLDENSKIWADEIAHCCNTARTGQGECLELLKSNGYDINTAAKQLEKIYLGGVNKDTFVVGTVGRMTEEKNQIFLVHVFEELVKVCPNSVLLLVGDGPERINISNSVKTLKVADKVIFTGQRTDIPDLLDSMDVFVLPSVYEGFPIAAVEAAANGLPIVLSDTITHELDFLENAKYLSLNEDYGTWAKAICSLRYCERENNQASLLAKKALDINSSAKILEGVYSGS